MSHACPLRTALLVLALACAVAAPLPAACWLGSAENARRALSMLPHAELLEVAARLYNQQACAHQLRDEGPRAMQQPDAAATRGQAMLEDNAPAGPGAPAAGDELLTDTRALGVPAASAIAIGDDPRDRAALADFYRATSGAQWVDRTGWLDDNVSYCVWSGVQCSFDGRVEALVSDNNGLLGTLPASLGDLTELRTLFIRGARNMGGSVPAALVNLTRLENLTLSALGITGNLSGTPFAAMFAAMPRLSALDISRSYISGTLPASMSALALTHVDMSFSMLSGTLPVFCAAWPQLAHLGECTAARPKALTPNASNRRYTAERHHQPAATSLLAVAALADSRYLQVPLWHTAARTQRAAARVPFARADANLRNHPR
jgi:hypothetical protein